MTIRPAEMEQRQRTVQQRFDHSMTLIAQGECGGIPDRRYIGRKKYEAPRAAVASETDLIRTRLNAGVAAVFLAALDNLRERPCSQQLGHATLPKHLYERPAAACQLRQIAT